MPGSPRARPDVCEPPAMGEHQLPSRGRPCPPVLLALRCAAFVANREAAGTRRGSDFPPRSLPDCDHICSHRLGGSWDQKNAPCTRAEEWARRSLTGSSTESA